MRTAHVYILGSQGGPLYIGITSTMGSRRNTT